MSEIIEDELSCTRSWIYNGNGFEEATNTDLYVFAFYYIFEVITTVGYGDVCGATSDEYIFLIALELLAISFFSILMASIGEILDF